MYKVIFSIFLAATALVLISSHSRAYNGYIGTAPQKTEMPETIVHDLGVINTRKLAPSSGSMAVTLWSSDDAASRVANAKLAAKARRDSNFTHIGINVDESPAMFRELLRRDRLDSDSLQLHASGKEAAKLLSSMGYTTVFN